MKRFFVSLLLSMTAVMLIAFSAFAGTWMQTSGRPANNGGVTNWWWQNDDGSWPKSQWAWIDGDGNGIAECYYFNSDGYMIAAPALADGYTVNAGGAWVRDGVVQSFPNAWVPGGTVLTSSGMSSASAVNTNPTRPIYIESELTHSGITEDQAYGILMQIKKELPEGTPWGDDELYISGNRYGYGCAAFIFRVQERLYGSNVKPRMDYSLDISQWKVGDHLRVRNNNHSVILLSKNADSVTVAEANYNHAVHWGRVITLDELRREFVYRETCY